MKVSESTYRAVPQHSINIFESPMHDHLIDNDVKLLGSNGLSDLEAIILDK